MEPVTEQPQPSAFRKRLGRYVVIVVVISVVAAVIGGAYFNVNMPGDPEDESFAWVSALVWGAMALIVSVLVVGAYEVFRIGEEEE